MNRTLALTLAAAFLAFVVVSTIAGRLPIVVLSVVTEFDVPFFTDVDGCRS